MFVLLFNFIFQHVELERPCLELVVVVEGEEDDGKRKAKIFFGTQNGTVDC